MVTKTCFHRPETGNEALERFVKVRCRLVDEDADKSLQRDLAWAKAQAEKHASAEEVEAVGHLAELCMHGASLARYADRKQPLIFLYNLTIYFPEWNSHRLFEEAKKFRDSKVQELFGARTHAIYKVCFHSAWGEQNTRDWDNAQAGALTGAAWGYQASMIEDSEFVRQFALKMGFDSFE